MFGYFKTKLPGFGPYNASTLIVILVLFVSALAYFSGNLSGDDLAKILLALVGFAAGLFVKE